MCVKHAYIAPSPRVICIHASAVTIMTAPSPLQASQQLSEEAPDAPSQTGIPASLYIQGLANPEHGCFFNAVVQMLASSALLNSERSLEELRSSQKLGPCLAEMMSSVNTFATDDQPRSAAQLLQHIAQKNPEMNGRVQQDSHEALMLLLDLLQQEMEAKHHPDGKPNPDQTGMFNVSPRTLCLLALLCKSLHLTMHRSDQGFVCASSNHVSQISGGSHETEMTLYCPEVTDLRSLPFGSYPLDTELSGSVCQLAASMCLCA